MYRRFSVTAKKKRFTLDLDPEVQLRLKVAAALKGISMRQYCLDASRRNWPKRKLPPVRVAISIWRLSIDWWPSGMRFSKGERL